MAGALGLVVQAHAQLYDITFSGDGYAANGQVDVSGGIATSGFLTVTAGNDLGTYQLFTANPTIIVPVGVTVNLTGDNAVFPSSNPFVDGGGLNFSGPVFDGNESDVAFNLFGNGPGSYSLFDGSATQYTQANGNATISLVAVPEPTTVIAGALLLLPFGASTIRVLRRNRAA